MWDTRIFFNKIFWMGHGSVFSILLMLFACQKDVELNLPNDTKITVTAEMQADQQPKLYLSTTGNVGLKTLPQPITGNAVVTLSEDGSNKKFQYRSLGDGYWLVDGMLPLAGTTYSLTVTTDQKELRASTTVPPSFNAEIKNTLSAGENIFKLYLSSLGKSDQSVIIRLQARSKLPQQPVNNGWQDEKIRCNDALTDNVRYNELSSPGLKLFLPAMPVSTIDFSPEYPDGRKEYRLLIKAVTPVYYKYSYTYECMKGGGSIIPLQSNIENGLGIFGGVVEKTIYL